MGKFPFIARSALIPLDIAEGPAALLPEGKTWRVVVIESGVSDNGNYYPESILQEAVPVFEGRPVAIYEFQGHMGVRYDHRPKQVRRELPYGVAGNVCGWLENVRYEVVESRRHPGQKVGALTADLNVTDAWLSRTLLESWTRGKYDLFELSIEALGPHQTSFHDGRMVHRLESISTALELTVVRKGAAGGRIMELVASDGTVTKEWEAGTTLSPLAHDLLSLSDKYPDVPWLELSSFIEAGPLRTAVTVPPNPDPQDTDQTLSDEQGYQKVVDSVEGALQALKSGNQDKAMASLDDAVALLFNYGQNQLDKKIGATPGQKPKAKTGSSTGGTEKQESKMEENLTPETPVPEETQAQNDVVEAAKLLNPSSLAGDPNKMVAKADNDDESGAGKKQAKCFCEKASCRECRHSAMTEAGEVLEQKAYRQSVGDMPTADYKPVAPAPIAKLLNPSSLAGDPNKMVAKANNKMGSMGSAKTENVQGNPGNSKEDGMEKEESGTAELQAQLEKMQAREHERELAECRRTLSWSLRDSGLPEVAKQEVETRYLSKLAAGQLFEEKEVQESIASFRRVIAPLAAGMVPQEHNARGAIVAVGVGAEKVDRVRADFDRICGFDALKADKMWARNEKTGRGELVAVTEAVRDIHRGLPGVPSPARWFAEVFDDPDQMGFGGYAGPCAMVRELMEATTADIPQLLGDSMTRALVQRYQDADYPWRPLCNVVPVSNFRLQRRILFGGLGLLPTTIESDSIDNYETLGLPADEETTYQVDTKGGLIKVTRRMIINDDLQAIQRMPQEAATSAAMTLTRLVLLILQGRRNGGLLNTDTAYDGVPYYHANHANLGVTGIGYQSFIDSRNRLRRQRRFANVGALAADMTNVATNMTLSVVAPYAQLRTAVKVGDTLRVEAELMYVTSKTGIGPNDITVSRGEEGSTAVAHLFAGNLRVEQLGAPIALPQIYTVYPFALESNVLQVFNSQLIPNSPNNDVNTIYGEVVKGRIVPLTFHEMFFGGDLNNWFNCAGSPIELGFLGGREFPELFLQDNPLVGDVFLKDTIAWKTRHEYGGVLVDPHTVDGNLVP